MGARRRPACASVGVVMDAGQDVEQRPRSRRRKPDAVGRKKRRAKGRGQRDQRLVVGLFLAAKMPLQLHVHAVAAEQPDEPLEQPADAVAPGVERGAAGERHESRGAAVQILQRQRALAFRRAKLHAREQAAEVPVAFLALAQDGQEELLIADCLIC